MRTWQCKGCGRQVHIEQDDLAEIGMPICGVCDTEYSDRDMELLPAVKARKLWFCPKCEAANAQKDRIVNSHDGKCALCGKGKPIGGFFVDEPAGRSKVRLIVQMFGGAIEQVFQDCLDAEIIDIIFTEDGKYLDGPPDRDKNGNLRFAIKSGPLKGQAVYAHFDTVEIGGSKMFQPVVKAAKARQVFRCRGRR